MSTAKSSDAAHEVPPVPLRMPPLEPGDRMTRDEFERRWEAMPELKRAELIDGVVYMAAALRHKQHGNPHSNLLTWMGLYSWSTVGVESGDASSMRLDFDNVPQPDCILRVLSEFGGQSKVDEDGYLKGAPELVGEVSASSTSYDLHGKLNVYRKHGVREYIVWRVLDEAIDWFVLCEGRFDRVELPADGIHRSQQFPGLWLSTKALLSGDGRSLLDTLQQGLATDEHAAFVKQLGERSQES